MVSGSQGQAYQMRPWTVSLSDCEDDILLGGDSSQIQDGISHPSEGRVDAYARDFGNLLEREVLIVSHVEHLPLERGKLLYEKPDVFADLVGDYDVFYCLLGQLLSVEHVNVLKVSRLEIFRFLLPIVVYYQVMRDSRYPGREFSVLGISALLDGRDSLDEGLLKDIVGHVLVFDYAEDIVENSVLVPFEEHVESVVVTLRISFDQILVGHA